MSSIYKVFAGESEENRLIFASSNINEAIEAAREYLEHKPTAMELTDLKNFFKRKPEETYTYSVNDKTATMTLTVTT